MTGATVTLYDSITEIPKDEKGHKMRYNMGVVVGRTTPWTSRMRHDVPPFRRNIEKSDTI